MLTLGSILTTQIDHKSVNDVVMIALDTIYFLILPHVLLTILHTCVQHHLVLFL